MLFGLGGLAATGALVGCDVRELARRHGAKQRLSIATGGTGGVYYPYGGAIARVIGARIPGVEATAEVTGGSIDNLKFVARGKADIAFTLADTLADAAAGREAFAAFGVVPARALAVLYPNYTQVATFEDEGIRSLADLAGRRVSSGAAGSGTETIATRILAAAGLHPDRDVRRHALGASASVDALRDGTIDALFWSGGVPTAALLDLGRTPGRRMRLLANAEALASLQARYGPHYLAGEIPAGAYPGIDAPVPVITVANLLVVDARLPDSLAYDVTRALFEGRDEIAAVHAEGRRLTVASAAVGSPVAFHPGAVRFYREQGVNVPASRG